MAAKNKLPLMMGVPREPDSEKIFVQTVIAMIWQHDPDAAKEMEEFWFKKQDLKSNRENADAAYWDPVLDPQLIEADSVFWNQ